MVGSSFLKNQNHITQALLATTFTYLMTVLGAAVIFLFKSIRRKILDGMLGFAAVFAAATVILVQPILPYAMSFAAGAMIFVVVEELIPESQMEKNTDVATTGAMIGFAFMMALDVAFG
ncbi:MAG: zinc transporter [Candidatus Marinimicrobia bacterium CG08_land_8_20_14_0_20_45_22]|nr:MAG: zinc transporter [Candidatus Marinimicrobia bacterium CG08_land_8_20_14_0_20_45_22]